MAKPLLRALVQKSDAVVALADDLDIARAGDIGVAPVDFGASPAAKERDSTVDALLVRFRQIRATSVALAAPLSAEDCQVQSMPDASPVKWHLAHTTWFFETFILSAYIDGYQPYSPIYKVLFNSYYNAVGDKHPRAARGMLSRPPLSDVLAYRAHVDHAMESLCQGKRANSPKVNGLLEIGLNHEQQHQELILTDVKHMLSCNPLRPAYLAPDSVQAMHRAFAAVQGLDHSGAWQRAATASRSHATTGDATGGQPVTWTRFEGGVVQIGQSGGNRFTFDNESPRHPVLLQPYFLANRPVTQGEFLAFVQDGGYQHAGWWLSAGWDTVCSRGWRAPMYWEDAGGTWKVFTLHGMRELDLDAPVTHVSYFEAHAYARWADARLPREAEWEHAASTAGEADAATYNLLESGRFAPAAPVDDSGSLAQMFGDVWEWTASSYDPYPGFRTPEGAVGEYNGKFMCNQYVLRGGSCITPASHIRASYRNFFPTDARWQFSGIRLARDAQ